MARKKPKRGLGIYYDPQSSCAQRFEDLLLESWYIGDEEGRNRDADHTQFERYKADFARTCKITPRRRSRWSKG